MNKERFWLPRKLIDEHARKLTVYELAVYVALARHANYEANTWVGCRRLGVELNINKNTVSKAISGLVAYGLVIHSKNGRHGVYGLRVPSVSFKEHQRLTEPYTSNASSNTIKESSKTIEKEINGRKYRVAVQQP